METKQLVQELTSMIQSGQILEAFDKFYADEVSMSENTNPPTIGKAANRDREVQFLSSVGEVHVNRPTHLIVDGNNVSLGWHLEFTNKEGVRIRLNQVSIQEWKDGQIVSERFVYDSANMVVA